MNSNGLVPDFKGAKALNVTVTKRWKGTSYYRAERIANDTLKVTKTEGCEVVLSDQERNRRLYNRDW